MSHRVRTISSRWTPPRSGNSPAFAPIHRLGSLFGRLPALVFRLVLPRLRDNLAFFLPINPLRKLPSLVLLFGTQFADRTSSF